MEHYAELEPEWHREFRRTAIRDGMRRKAEAGGTPGCAPVGYRNRRDEDGNAYVEIDPVQGPLVRVAFELMATGDYSLRKLLAVMTERGLRSRNGRPMRVSGLWSVLNNSFYIGKTRFGLSPLEGSHQPLVSLSNFYKANVGAGVDNTRSRPEGRKDY